MMKLNQKGFTLVEVLAVVAIIAVLGIIAIPNVLNTIDAGKDGSYKILVQDIKTAGIELFEELEFMSNDLFWYGNDGIKGDKIKINNNYVVVNLQSLVNNGFLSGINNDGGSDANKNKKIILNPKTKDDIGICEIKITKEVGDYSKVSYVVEAYSNNKGCPAEYK